MILNCGSKTFLLGEYLALKGLPCLLASTEPRFQLSIQSGNGKSPFHPESPAGRAWRRHFDVTRQWKAEFTNPIGIGGLGASSAEFLLLATALQVQNTLAVEAQLEPDLSALLKEYSEVNADATTPPSGADLVAQLRGRITLFERGRGRLETRGWGFRDLSFLLFSTGQKTPTHDHLATLGNWNETDLLAAVESGIKAWNLVDPGAFITAVRETRAELRSLGFEAAATTALIEEILQIPQVLAAKGCGALGADVIMLTCHPDDKESIKVQIQQKLRFLADEQSLTEGLQVFPHQVSDREVEL